MDRSGTPSLGGSLQQLLCTGLHGEPSVLLSLGPGDRGDALDEVEDALGRAAFFSQHRLNDLVGLRLREAALAQEVGAVLVAAGDDPFACGTDALDERLRRGVGEVGKRRGRLVREAIGGVFGVPDGDLLEVFTGPMIFLTGFCP